MSDRMWARNLALSLALTCAAPLWSQAPAAAPAAQAPAPAPQPTKVEPYQRVRDDADGMIVLELASRTFAKKGADADKAPRIELVSAIHIADQAFYDAMQKALDAHELVLFEGVRPPGTGTLAVDATDAQRAAATRGRLEFLKDAIEAHRQREGSYPRDFDDLIEHANKRWRSVFDGARTDGWGRAIRFERVAADAERKTNEHIELVSEAADGKVRSDDIGELRVAAKGDASAAPAAPKAAGLQQKLAQSFGLVFQLDAMDSSKSNWRSSDMSVDQLMARFKETGADASGLLGMLDGTSLLARFAGVLLDIIAANPQMRAIAKMAIVEVIGSSDGLPSGGLGMGFGQSMDKLMKVIVEERNAVVVKDLRAIIDGESPPKTIAVFYGAGHMNDLERRVCDELGYEPVETTWTLAIRADPKAAGFTTDQLKQMRDMMKRMMNAAAPKAKKPSAE